MKIARVSLTCFGGVSINKQKVEDATHKPSYDFLLQRFLLAQKGKKNYFLIEITD
jgi:tyrosyl-tRNA synthetase